MLAIIPAPSSSIVLYTMLEEGAGIIAGTTEIVVIFMAYLFFLSEPSSRTEFFRIICNC